LRPVAALRRPAHEGERRRRRDRRRDRGRLRRPPRPLRPLRLRARPPLARACRPAAVVPAPRLRRRRRRPPARPAEREVHDAGLPRRRRRSALGGTARARRPARLDHTERVRRRLRQRERLGAPARARPEAVEGGAAVNVWLVAATVLLAALVLPFSVLVRGSRIEALLALELTSVVVTLVLLLLSEGYHRSIYTTLPLVLAALSFVGGLVFARFME